MTLDINYFRRTTKTKENHKNKKESKQVILISKQDALQGSYKGLFIEFWEWKKPIIDGIHGLNNGCASGAKLMLQKSKSHVTNFIYNIAAIISIR